MTTFIRFLTQHLPHELKKGAIIQLVQQVTYLLDEDISSKTLLQEKSDFGVGVVGTNYSLADFDSNLFEIDSDGIVSIKTSASSIIKFKKKLF